MDEEHVPSPVCSCGQISVLVYGDTVYPHRPDLAHKPFYVCNDCDTRVGCHPNTLRPLGNLASFELRKARMAAHEAFDTLWKTKRMSRSKAYAWLAKELHMSKTRCHIGNFDEATCQRVVALCDKEERNK